MIDEHASLKNCWFTVDVEWQHPVVRYVERRRPDASYEPAPEELKILKVPAHRFSHSRRLWLSSNSEAWRDGYTSTPRLVEEAVASIEPPYWQFDVTTHLMRMIQQPDWPGKMFLSHHEIYEHPDKG